MIEPFDTGGFGGHYVTTFKSRLATHIHDGRDYTQTPLAEIVNLAKDPQVVNDKDRALCFMASSYNAHDARSHEVQRVHGRFNHLRGDIDSGNHDKGYLLEVVQAFTGQGVATCIYSTGSASVSEKNWRVIVPLAVELGFDEWSRLQRAFNHHLTEFGIAPDRSTERSGQYMRAPVRVAGSDFYDCELVAGGGLSAAGAGVALLEALAAIDASDEVARQAREAASKRASERAQKAAKTGGNSTGVIDAFNAQNPLGAVFAQHGFETKNGVDWHHPLQTSDSYSWRDCGDGAWVCVSSMAKDHGIGAVSSGGFGFGDAFDLECFFRFGDDNKRAVAELSKVVTVADENGEILSWDEKTRRDYLASQQQAQEPQEDSGPPLKPVSVADVITSPSEPPKFIWGRYVPQGVVTMLGAHGGTGKSTLALMLAASAAVGRPLFGAEVSRCPALFVSLEDGAAVVRHRLAYVCEVLKICPQELDGWLHVVDGTDRPELFSAQPRGEGTTTETYSAMLNLVREVSAGLVIVDNASDAFGGDEIQRRQVRGFMRSLAKVAQATDCGLVLLAHVDKNTSRNKRAEGGEGYSGSTAWHNSARSRLFLTRGDDGRLTLEHQKSNLGRMAEPITLEWPEGGLPRLSGSDPVGVAELAGLLRQADDRLALGLLDLLREYEQRGEYCHTAANSRSNPYALLKADPIFKALKLNAESTKRIVTHCHRAHWIDRLDYRTPDRKPHQRWTVTDLGLAALSADGGLLVEIAPSAPSCAK